MSIKLIGIDIDGTLLNSRKELTQATIDALQAAADHGIQVVISTGRLLSEYVDLVAQLPMMRYNVTCTGTQVLDLQTGEDIFRCAMTADELRYLCGKLRGLDCFLQIFSDVDGKIHNDVRHMAQAERFCGEGLARMVRNHHVAEPDIYEYIEGYTGVTNKIHIFFADPAVKAEAIRRMEGEPYAVMILPDHPTPICRRTHTLDPVPYLIWRSDRKENGVDLFCEKTAEAKGNYLANGYCLMEKLTRG